MTEQDKKRIDRSAELYSNRVVVQHIYIDGATSEHQYMAELLKEERNNAMDFYRWMVWNGWSEDSSKEYFYRSANRNDWPPDETATEKELIEKWFSKR